MNNKIKNVLKKLEDNGYKAYIVGGYVRDYLLGIESFDIDIATDALPKTIREIFGLSGSNEDNYGSICLKDSLYNYDITTFREEIKYENRRPVGFRYIDNIDEDIKRRDFTINALYMDSQGQIIDNIKGQVDLQNKVIRMIGNINDRMCEDPLRILRAIRFAVSLNFKLEDNLFYYIKQNKQLVRTLSYTRRKEELSKIFQSSNKEYSMQLLKDLNILDVLELEVPDHFVPCANELGIWAQIAYAKGYPFTKTERDVIQRVKKVVSYGVIDNIVLYECGLYPTTIAGEILGVSQAQISDIYQKMPIYSAKDLCVNGDDVQAFLQLAPSRKIKHIIHDLELNILNENIQNNVEDVKKFLTANWR